MPKRLILLTVFFFAVAHAQDGQMSVEGRVLAPDGSGVRGARVALIPSDFDEVMRRKYHIDELIPGDYVIMVNEGGAITPEEPFTRHYYNGEKNKRIPGKVVGLSGGDMLTGMDIFLEKVYEVVKVSGRMVYEDGKPAGKNIGIAVRATHPDEFMRSMAKWTLNDDGTFSMRVLKGGRVIFFPGYFLSSFRIKSCDPTFTDRSIPDSPRFLTKKAGDWKDVNGEITNWEIRLPFKKCKVR
jgi:hypothetical protein